MNEVDSGVRTQEGRKSRENTTAGKANTNAVVQQHNLMSCL